HVVSAPCVAFAFSAPSPTDIYTLALHDALPISQEHARGPADGHRLWCLGRCRQRLSNASDRDDHSDGAAHGSNLCRCCQISGAEDRKSTRLNSSHVKISYAVFCLKKKNKKQTKL